MNLNPIYSSSVAGGITETGQKLFRSLSGALNNGAKVTRQAMPIGQSAAERYLGTSEEFLQRYQNFENEYFRYLADPSRRSKYSQVMSMDLERASGRLDLSRLTYSAQQELKDIFLQNVLNVNELLPGAGAPGMEFPTGNLYTNLLNYQVESGEHAGLSLLRRMFFNVDPRKQGLASLGFGTSNMLSVNTLKRISTQGDFMPEARS